jgi:hypothetical protein
METTAAILDETRLCEEKKKTRSTRVGELMD